MGRQSRLKEERRQQRKGEKLAFEARVADGERRGCLVCRQSDGGFTTVEHALPESLGNTGIVLDNGVVCDRCNNGTLSDLDQALTEFWPLKLRRTFLGIQSKAGKIPVTRFEAGTVSNMGDAKIVIEHLYANDNTTLKKTSLSGNRVKLDLAIKGGKRMTPRYCAKISRALLKGALECAWLDQGETMLDPKWDHVREAILGQDRRGYLLLVRKADPDFVSLQLTYDTFTRTSDDREFIGVATNLFGVVLATDSLFSEPDREVPDELALTVTF